MDTQRRFDWLVSCDDHIMEPPYLWEKFTAPEYRDRAPKLLREKDADYWLFEGKKTAMLGLLTAMGRPKEEWTPDPTTYASMRPGCYDVRERLKDMDRGGVLASLCFGTVTGFAGQLWLNAQDKELAMACLRAWNDWLFEEWCAAAPGRFIPCIQIPLWDVELAVEEVKRSIPRGARAITFPENPGALGAKTLNDREGYWDPLWKICADHGLVICMHQGTGGKRFRTAWDTPEVATMAWGIGTMSSGCLLDWLFSPIFHRFPNLRIALSEGGIGWMPYFVERAEEVLNNHRAWASKGERKIDITTQTISEATENLVDFNTLDIRKLFNKHVSGCFIHDEAGLRMIDIIGEDNVCFETDYPHSDCKWPDNVPYLYDQMRNLTDDQKYKIMRGNAERIYNFTPSEPPF